MNCTAMKIKEVLQECKEYGEYIAEEDMENILKEWHYHDRFTCTYGR